MSKNRTPYITRLLDLVRQSKDRRGAPRYSPSESVAACLCWHAGKEHQYTKSEILNVSMTGVMLRVVEVPPENAPVWVRLEEPNPTDWVEADVVRVNNHWGEPKTARLRFREPCPYDIFKAAVNGFASKNGFMTLPKDSRAQSTGKSPRSARQRAWSCAEIGIPVRRVLP
jgi:hypothetical protein